jgi:hypothetical protein
MLLAIYDPPSNALTQVQAFTTSELRGPVRFVDFLQRQGQFLAIAGRTDVVLLDLVMQRGKLPRLTPAQRC